MKKIAILAAFGVLGYFALTQPQVAGALLNDRVGEVFYAAGQLIIFVKELF